MNQPTREEFEQLKEQVKRLEQETEPIRLVRRLSIPESNTLQQTFDGVARANTEIGLLKGQMAGARADITAIKESQADFRDALKTAKDDIASIKATQDEQGAKLDQILQLLQQKPSE